MEKVKSDIVFGNNRLKDSLDKLRKLRTMLKENNAEHIEVEVDGGIKLDNIKAVSDAGCDIFVSGSGIFKANDPKQMIKQMIKEVE